MNEGEGEGVNGEGGVEPTYGLAVDLVPNR